MFASHTPVMDGELTSQLIILTIKWKNTLFINLQHDNLKKKKRGGEKENILPHYVHMSCMYVKTFLVKQGFESYVNLLHY